MKVLLVEDEPKIAAAIARGLKQEKYVVEICHSGADGLGAALGGEYDVMILDRMLPGVEGVEICRQARAAGVKTPILILTAKSQIRDRVAGLNAGADDYLIKPFSFEELLARIRALLRRPDDLSSDKLQIADLTLDTVKHEARRGRQRLDLTATEFRLLEYMLRHAGQALTKDKIINHVWDFDADVLPNTVEAYIGSLRRKVDKPFAGRNLIKTLRGFGYSLDAGN
ncbi:MAG: response regulator transcription factor [Candidatus Nomurabacteria bacterium]|jgi:DNA-binding response OmpR family regulator|nr:response regulator transcription factor [Candidatus Nomurabacteria bacterium]